MAELFEVFFGSDCGHSGVRWSLMTFGGAAKAGSSPGK